jgi:CIC family chloride channel protein
MPDENAKLENASTADKAQARSELQEYLEVRQEQHGLFPRAALVGLCAGSVAVLFRFLLAAADDLRNGIIQWSSAAPLWGWIAPVLFTATGATLALMLVREYAPETSGSGIPHLKAVLHRVRELAWVRVLAVKLIGGVLSIGTGLALGREGPTVQMGGAVGDGISRWLKVSTSDRLILTAAGAGAGLTAAFNAPLSGLVFVLEEIQRDFRPAVFGAAFLAAAAADVVARLASGQLPVFNVPAYPLPPLGALPIFAILGCVAGVLGVFFNRTLIVMLNWVSGFKEESRWTVAAVVGGVTGLIAWFDPLIVGGGHGLAEKVLVGKIVFISIPILFLIRFGLTTTAYATGVAGGIFSPLLVLGSLVGLAIGDVGHRFVPSLAPEPGVFAVVGMAAYFTAIVRAPLTGIVLIIEMTGNYAQMLPLLISCFCAYAVAEYLKDLPIYEALLERDLERGNLRVSQHEPIVTEFEVEPGAPFAGRQVRDLGLPAGCVLVRSYADGREWVPTANTFLEVGMRITAVITPDASDALMILRRGCQSKVES